MMTIMKWEVQLTIMKWEVYLPSHSYKEQGRHRSCSHLIGLILSAGPVPGAARIIIEAIAYLPPCPCKMPVSRNIWSTAMLGAVTSLPQV